MSEANVDSVTESGTIVTRRFSGADKAQAAAKRFVKNDLQRGYNYTRIKCLIDGNAPLSATKLKRLGQSWRSNVNWREAKGIVRSKKTAYWEMLIEVPTLITTRIRGKARKPHQNEPRRLSEWEEIIAEEYTNVLTEWPAFYYEMDQLSRDMMVNGPSIAYWKDPDNWKFAAGKGIRVLCPKSTKANVTYIKLFCVRDDMDLDDIMKILSDPNGKVSDDDWQEQSEEVGWNISALKKAVVTCWKKGENAKGGQDEHQEGVYMSAQQALKNNEYGTTEEEFATLHIFHFFVMEPSGKVSHLIVPEDFQPEATDWLFNAPEQYEDMTQAAAFFFYDLEDGYFHSVRGIGSEIFHHVELSNRFINSTVDGSIVSASVIVKNTGDPNAEPRLLRLGPITELPAGYEPIQTSFAPRVGDLVSVRTMIHQILNNSQGVFRPRQEDPNVPEKTAQQIRSEEMKEGRFEKSQTYSFYTDWDLLHRETYRRLENEDYPTTADGYKEHERFVQNCIDRGVPRELMRPENLLIRSYRAIGHGSPAVRDAVTKELVQLSPGFDEEGKINAVRDRVAALAGWDKVDRYRPMVNRDRVPTDASSHAQLENNDMMEGSEVIVGEDQLHLAHFRTHVRPMVRIQQQFEQQPQQLQAEKAAQYFSLAIPHCETHIGYLNRDPRYRKEVKAAKEILQVLARTFRQIQGVAQQIAQARQQQIQQSRQVVEQARQQVEGGELQLKLAKLQQDFEMEVQKQQSIMAMREAKARHGMMIDEMKAQAEIDLANRKAGAS